MSNPERCVRCGRLGASRRLDHSFRGAKEMLKIYRWRLASLVMALTAIVGLALPALGDDERPFRGHADEMIIDAKPVADGLLVTATGAGQATHLGRFTRLGMVVIHADGSVEGTVVFTAANGDQLFMEANGRTDESGYAQHNRWDLHVHWGDRPVQRRVGRGGVFGSYCVQMVFISPSLSRAPYSTERRTGQRARPPSSCRLSITTTLDACSHPLDRAAPTADDLRHPMNPQPEGELLANLAFDLRADHPTDRPASLGHHLEPVDHAAPPSATAHSARADVAGGGRREPAGCRGDGRLSVVAAPGAARGAVADRP